MQITDARTVDVCVPLSTHGRHEPVTMWYGTRYAGIKTIIFLETDEGITGLGEAWGSCGLYRGGSQAVSRGPGPVRRERHWA